MSILIKDMKMPKGCLECPFKDIGMSTMTQCLLVAGWIDYANDGYGIPDACPLVELPEKHGRLVDADAIIKEMESMKVEGEVFTTAVNYAAIVAREALTVIEAEGEEE